MTADAIRYDTYGANAGEQADAPDIPPRDFVVPGITFDGDTTLQIDGLTIVARELGAGEAPATTAYYLPATRELFPGDAILNRLHGPLREAHTEPWLGILDRLEAMYPNVAIVHPGHGASGPKEPMFDDERLYLRTCRAIAAEEIARGGFTDAAKAATVRLDQRAVSLHQPDGHQGYRQRQCRGPLPRVLAALVYTASLMHMCRLGERCGRCTSGIAGNGQCTQPGGESPSRPIARIVGCVPPT
ncbi:hypothetical protein ABIA95_004171 [Bradyrhizobium sp. LA8.1]|uniref:hypothetical protein n=1 Tax=unclassified Bradyrhizobium TaxID=2631580 RepID=UPI0033974657